MYFTNYINVLEAKLRLRCSYDNIHDNGSQVLEFKMGFKSKNSLNLREFCNWASFCLVLLTIRLAFGLALLTIDLFLKTGFMYDWANF